MLLERILRGLSERLDGRVGGATRADRVICLDDSQASRQGCLLLIFGDDGAAPSLVAKAAPIDAARRRAGQPIYELEFENLRSLEQRGLNRHGPAAPLPLAAWRDAGLLFTVQTALAGELLKNVPGRALFGPQPHQQTLDSVLGWWKRFQQCFGVQRVLLDEGLYGAMVRQPVQQFLSRFRTEADERDFLSHRLEREQRLLGLELPLMVRHGDFCPANMLRLQRTVALFDWEFPLRHGLPLFDLFHFFASVRFPFAGLRGESGHFASFCEVFWGASYFSRAVRGRLAEVADEQRIPREALGDLFLLSLIEIANLKYEALIEIHGAPPPSPGGGPGTAGSTPWELAGGTDKDVPFACIRGAALQNLRFIVRNGPPRLLPD